ncbi:MAG: family N-acetyltransferase [Microvirga sp.]|jgi:ribosomal-protein-alanine N-acetyltransferase|nr:family N-acetyltransferase [Microvirga sp.]
MRTRVTITKVCADDCAELIAANLASLSLHEPWVQPFRDETGFLTYLARCDGERSVGFIVREWTTGQVAGVVNLNDIVRGLFQSAYLGYYGVFGLTGRGFMRDAVGLVLTHAFSQMDLHRVEANIQPANSRSLRLVESLGFRREGYSPRYLKIGGEWRDHERWAILSDEWSSGRADGR